MNRLPLRLGLSHAQLPEFLRTRGFAYISCANREEVQFALVSEKPGASVLQQDGLEHQERLESRIDGRILDRRWRGRRALFIPPGISRRCRHEPFFRRA